MEVKNELQAYQWRFPRICRTPKREIQTNISIVAQKEQLLAKTKSSKAPCQNGTSYNLYNNNLQADLETAQTGGYQAFLSSGEKQWQTVF